MAIYSIIGFVTIWVVGIRPRTTWREVRPGHDQLSGKAGADGGDQRDHQRLEVAKSLVLQQEDEQHVERGQTHTPHQRNSEQQVQGNGRADHLGQITCRDGDLAQNPQHETDWARVVVPAGLRQISAGCNAKFQGQRLEENCHQVREQDHAQQGIPEPRPAGQIGCPVSGVHVAHGHHVTRPGKGERLAPEGNALGHMDSVIGLGQARERAGITPAAEFADGLGRGSAHTALVPAHCRNVTELAPDDLPLSANLDGHQVVERLPVQHRDQDARLDP